MSYIIYNEDGEKMRVVGRKEEAENLIQNRTGWTIKCVRKTKVKPTYQFEEAPF
jgi:hypothetical protein